MHPTRRLSADLFLKDLFDEAISETGTWSSTTIHYLMTTQNRFTESDLSYIVDQGFQLVIDPESSMRTKFKIAQLFSQLYHMHFPQFNNKFIQYIDPIKDYICIPQSSYLWQPMANLMSSIIVSMPLNSLNTQR